MNKKIIFQKCNFNYIYFLFNIIAIFLNFFIEYKLYPEGAEIKEPEHHYYLPLQIISNLYAYNISDFLVVIPYLIRKKILKEKRKNINKTKINNNNPFSNDISLFYISGEKAKSKKRKKK